MISVVYGAHFLKSAAKLPVAQQRALASLLLLCRENPFHPQLHTKRLSGPLAGYLSFRITREWRVIFIFLAADTIQLLRTAHRKDIYR